jgi:transposase
MQDSISLDDPVPGQKRSPGRPTKKTKAVTDRLFAAIERGMPCAMACELSGISEAVFYQWRQDSAFDTEVMRRTRESVFELLDTIKEARHQNWQAAAFLLERRWPRHYGRAEAQLNFEVAIQNNINNQTVNNTLVVTAEVAGEISSRVRDVDAKIEKLLKDKRGDNGNGQAIPEPSAGASGALMPALIVMPVGEPGPGWWRTLTSGSGEREVERTSAERVCRLIVEDVFGRQRAQQTPICFDAERPILLRDVYQTLDAICQADGWSALRRRGEI